MSASTIGLLSNATLGVLVSCRGLDLLAWLLADDVEDAILECLLVLRKPILLPGVVKDTGIEVVSLHALFEETDASPVVWLLLELERAAVLHKLPELRRVSATQLLK